MTTQTGSQPALISSLLSGAAFSHQANHPRLIETHISWVILTGEFAYKIKKPVNLGFVDFSTLELRQHFCEEEIRLNRRTAPDLYLDVVPISADEDGFRVGTGPAVEYAVRMRQFPDDARLDQQLEMGKLDEQDLHALAASIASFHAGLPVRETSGDDADLRRVWKPVQVGFDHIKPALDDPLDLSVLSQIEVWTQIQFNTLKQRFRCRARNGFVREGHGDLHLANLFRMADRIIPFDCLEFNPGLRWIDQVSDIAFLIMDLMAKGREDLASAFLNTWLEHSGDYEGLEVLRFYIVYRCLVRAKVAAIRVRSSADIFIGDSKRECRRYLYLALKLVNHPRPCLLITHGFSGSGKSWLGRHLATALPAVRVRSDIERKRLFGLKPMQHSGSELDSGMYGADATEQTYEKLAAICETGVRAGFNMIADATFLQRHQRQRFLHLAAWLRAKPVILDCSAPTHLLLQRIERRLAKKQTESEATLLVLEQQLRHHQPLDPQEQMLAVRMPARKEDAMAGLLEQIRGNREKAACEKSADQPCPVS